MSYVSRYIGNTLKNLRLDENLSLVTLTRETKINIFKLTGYELGVLNPDGNDLTILADYFRCTIDFIIGTDSPNIDKLEGNTLPQKLRDAGITSVACTKGHEMTDEQVDGLIEFINKVERDTKKKNKKNTL